MKQKWTGLFLDLEETLIDPILDDNWQAASFIPKNVAKIRKFIDETNPELVQIFSFAIRGPSDDWAYRTNLHHRIEEQLDCRVTCSATRQEMIEACASVMNLHEGNITHGDLTRMWDKQLAFRMYGQYHFGKLKDTNLILIDDMVQRETTTFPKKKLSINFYNINEL